MSYQGRGAGLAEMIDEETEGDKENLQIEQTRRGCSPH